MASGYVAYEINGTLYRDLSEVSHADRILVSALIYEHGVPPADAPPEVFQVQYDPNVIFPTVRAVRLTHDDLTDAFSDAERTRILEKNVLLPPSVCDRLLGHLVFHGLLRPGSVDRTLRFVLQSTLNSEDIDFWERLDEARTDGAVDFGTLEIETFFGTHILVDRAAGAEPSVNINARPARPDEQTPNDGRSRDTSPPDGPSGEAFQAPDFRGTDVDPEDAAVPEDVADDLNQLRDAVDDDHDFGASYDFRPTHPSDDDLGIDTPDEFAAESGEEFDDSPDTAGSSLTCQFGPSRSLEQDLGSAQYQFGPTRSLEEDLSGGVSRSWQNTMDAVARTEDTSATYTTATYDFNTDDLYDFTPPSYDVTPSEETDAENDASADATTGEGHATDAERWSAQTVAAVEEQDDAAVGARVVGENAGGAERSRAQTNDPLSTGCLLQAFAVIAVVVIIAVLALQL